MVLLSSFLKLPGGTVGQYCKPVRTTNSDFRTESCGHAKITEGSDSDTALLGGVGQLIGRDFLANIPEVASFAFAVDNLADWLVDGASSKSKSPKLSLYKPDGPPSTPVKLLKRSATSQNN